MSSGPHIASVRDVMPAAWNARCASMRPRWRSSGVDAGATVRSRRDACGYAKSKIAISNRMPLSRPLPSRPNLPPGGASDVSSMPPSSSAFEFTTPQCPATCSTMIGCSRLTASRSQRVSTRPSAIFASS